MRVVVLLRLLGLHLIESVDQANNLLFNARVHLRFEGRYWTRDISRFHHMVISI